MGAQVAAEQVKRSLQQEDAPEGDGNRPGKNKKTLLSKKQAQLLVDELSHLKGAAMKVGQLLSLEARDYLPPDVLDVLEKLSSDIGIVMSKDQVVEILRTELVNFGQIERLSDKPIAAASIGQVHQAYVFDKPVAVKVQYPGIRKSLKSDIKILTGVLRTAGFLVKRSTDFGPLLDEFTSIFEQESDYEQEAHFMRAYGVLARSQGYIVPHHLENLSSAAVLTMDFCVGHKLSVWGKDAAKERREALAKKILELYMLEFCDWGLVQTDPNLGNFLVDDQDRLILLDFGATKAYSFLFRRQYAGLVVAAYESDKKSIIRLSEEMGLIDARENDDAKAVFCQLMLESMRPMKLSWYDFTESSYALNMRALTRSLVGSLRFSAPPRNLIFLHRKLSGVFHMVKMLSVGLDLRSYVQRYRVLKDLPEGTSP
jgi:aarF domain-containing kinase